MLKELKKLRRPKVAPSVAKLQQIDLGIETVGACLETINMFMLSPRYQQGHNTEIGLRIEDMRARVQKLRKSAIKAGMTSSAKKTAVLLDVLDLLATAATD